LSAVVTKATNNHDRELNARQNLSLTGADRIGIRPNSISNLRSA